MTDRDPIENSPAPARGSHPLGSQPPDGSTPATDSADGNPASLPAGYQSWQLSELTGPGAVPADQLPSEASGPAAIFVGRQELEIGREPWGNDAQATGQGQRSNEGRWVDLGAGYRREDGLDTGLDDGREDDEVWESEVASSRWRWPAILFALTVLSTVWVGICGWSPLSILELCLAEVSLMPLRRAILANWQAGLWYSLFLLAILMAHELGHYLMAKWYRVPATPPIFLPFPINSIGTLGAVIAMRGHEADRRQIFDIGLAGPLAGLVLAFPIAVWGTWHLDLSLPRGGGLGFEIPLAMRWMIGLFHPEYTGQVVWLSQLNPAFTAAWVALLVTGLNMMPVSQLDGGHVTYGLFGRRAHWISYGLLIFAIAYMVYQQVLIMALMVVLLLLMGPTHPPTRDDHVRLGWPRFLLGLTSLLIPVLCFPPNVFKFNF
jgi:Zn-dependent protease